MKSKTQYSSGSKLLHWLIAVIVIVMLSGSFFLEDLPETIKSTAIMLHKSFGLTILGLMVLRLVWIIRSGKPALPSAVPRWERYLSHAIQHSLYLLLFLMPVCGWIMSVAAAHTPTYFGLFEVPFPGIVANKALSNWMFSAHETIAWIIIGLLVLHVAGALKHLFIDKDNVFQKMWP